MPSFTSSSESATARKRPGLNRAAWLLIGVAILIYGGAEAGARLGFSRISKLHHRIMTEQQAALAIRPAPSGSPPTLLVVGNSLLLEGLDFPRFTKEVSPRFQASRFVVEGTAYNDWY